MKYDVAVPAICRKAHLAENTRKRGQYNSVAYKAGGVSHAAGTLVYLGFESEQGKQADGCWHGNFLFRLAQNRDTEADGMDLTKLLTVASAPAEPVRGKTPNRTPPKAKE